MVFSFSFLFHSSTASIMELAVMQDPHMSVIVPTRFFPADFKHRQSKFARINLRTQQVGISPDCTWCASAQSETLPIQFYRRPFDSRPGDESL
jgi:hypothetical protein